ncbi:hypothetical protein ACHAXN_000949, partial [Cyclotella atomus]
MSYQLITPHIHRANIAERSIQTFKNHFTSVLSGVDDSFPLHLWDRSLPQAKMTLNMLRPANATPTLFETPEAWKSWDAHSIDGWYLGSSLEHYRNSVIWVKNSRAERISDT